MAAHRPPLDRPLATAINQLMKTAKSLSGRLNRMAAEASVSRSSPTTGHVTLPVNRSDAESAKMSSGPAVLAQSEVDTAPQTDKNEKLATGPFEDARRFPRSSFRGSARRRSIPAWPAPAASRSNAPC